jgi:hypothetical protein
MGAASRSNKTYAVGVDLAASGLFASGKAENWFNAFDGAAKPHHQTQKKQTVPSFAPAADCGIM